jgi:hypothetical protein
MSCNERGKINQQLLYQINLTMLVIPFGAVMGKLHPSKVNARPLVCNTNL